VFAWSSLAHGFFSNPYDPKNPGGNRRSRWCATHFGTEENVQRLHRARIFAREHHVTVAQVALAYVRCHPLHALAVVGCSTSEKFAENVAALSLNLDDATLHWLATGQASQ
jgi:aryl-alcohol dehydrogenase-like predicted oxidoreductase